MISLITLTQIIGDSSYEANGGPLSRKKTQIHQNCQKRVQKVATDFVLAGLPQELVVRIAYDQIN